MNVLVLCLALLIVGCSSDDKNNTNQTPNNQSDVGADDGEGSDMNNGSDSESDAGSDLGGDMSVFLPSCNGAVALNTTIPLNPEGRGGQLYARTAWDGSGAWVTWAGPQVDGGPEAVMLARVDCKGAIEVGPIQLSPDDGARHLQPTIASAEGSTFVVWYSQTMTGETAIWTRVYDQTGAEQTTMATDVTPLDQGVPVSMLIWDVDVAAVDAGNAAVTFSFADTGFIVGVQRIDASGARVGDFFVPVNDPDGDQKTPSIGRLADGGLVLSWIRQSDAADDQALVTHIPPGAIAANPVSGVPGKPLTTPNPLGRVSKSPSGDGTSYMAFQVTSAMRSDILLRDATDLSGAETTTFGTTNFNNFRASVATGDVGGAIAWYRYNQTPLRNQVVLQAFAADGTPGEETTLTMDADGIPPYGPAITHVENEVFFVSWSEGDGGPSAQVQGRFVALPTP